MDKPPKLWRLLVMLAAVVAQSEGELGEEVPEALALTE